MDAKAQAQLGDILASCVRDLFGRFGVPLSERDAGVEPAPSIEGDATMTVVGFAGEQMRGTLTLLAPDGVFARSYAAAGGEAGGDPNDVQGWAAEFSNLLLGRIKCALLSYGVVLQISTPTAFGGRELSLQGAPPSESLERGFEVAGEPLYLCFRAITAPAFAFTLLPEAPPLASEGEPLFF
ncbi:MAG: chemotaxis protein CheX [Polyangiaceae bacterium]|jgi:CheY-specific phosphatase CheX|nr:chemotaxis protein CheX [Polyangiaceae bacterium]